MTDTMVARVAAAIWALQRDTDCNDYSKLTAATKALADKMARAAITAMREPTEAMRQAGVHEHALTSDPGDIDQVSAPWAAMIDSALNPSPTPRE